MRAALAVFVAAALGGASAWYRDGPRPIALAELGDKQTGPAYREKRDGIDAVKTNLTFRACNPDRHQSAQKVIRWVPLSKLRITQNRMKPVMEKGHTVLKNILEKPDPRSIPCLQVYPHNDEAEPQVYWTEGTRRPASWLLGALPPEFREKDVVPVEIKSFSVSGKPLADAVIGTFGPSALTAPTPILVYPGDKGVEILQNAWGEQQALKEWYQEQASADLKLIFAEDVASECNFATEWEKWQAWIEGEVVADRTPANEFWKRPGDARQDEDYHACLKKTKDAFIELAKKVQARGLVSPDNHDSQDAHLDRDDALNDSAN